MPCGAQAQHLRRSPLVTCDIARYIDPYHL